MESSLSLPLLTPNHSINNKNILISKNHNFRPWIHKSNISENKLFSNVEKFKDSY